MQLGVTASLSLFFVPLRLTLRRTKNSERLRKTKNSERLRRTKNSESLVVLFRFGGT
jgi:hypothetical protein